MANGPVVGLDIGTQQIKAVELRPNRGMLTVSALGIAPTPVGVMQNNIITDPRLMGQTVKQLLRESGIKANKVIGSVAGQSAVVVRIIEVPKMTDAELKETMKWEVERHVPFAPSETRIAYERLDPLVPDDMNPNMEVLLAVAQQDILNNFIDTVYAAGLDPVAIDIEQLAVGRGLLDVVQGRPVVRSQFTPSYEAPYEQSVETVAIVNIGAANTDICIYQQGQIAFPRSLPLAGDSLTRAIAEAMGYTLDQAERIKREYASVQLDRMAIYTGTAYYDDGSFGGQFADDDSGLGTGRESGRISGRSSGRVSGRSGRISGRLGGDDAPLSNPFDLSLEGEPTQQDPLNLGRGSGEDALNLGRTETDPLDRTQPMSRESLNLGGYGEEGAAVGQPDQFGQADLPGSANFLGGPSNETEVRDQVFEAIAPVLGEIATELRRSFDYFRSRAQGRTVDRVLLAGGSAALPNLDQFLNRELQIPVVMADPFTDVAVVSKHYDPGYLRTIASAFAVAFGLAARSAVLDANPAPKRKGGRQRVVAQQPEMPPAA